MKILFRLPETAIATWLDGLDWVVVGGESGHGHRVCEVDWITDIVDQCVASDVRTFVKQDSGLRPGHFGRIPLAYQVGQFPR